MKVPSQPTPPSDDAAAHLAAVLDSLPDAATVYDREWRYVYANPVARALHRRLLMHAGASAEEAELPVLGRVAWEVFPWLVGTKFETESRRAVAEGRMVEYVEHVPLLGIWYETRILPTARGAVSFNRDITARSEAESQAREAEALARQLFALLPIPTWVLDKETLRFLDVNDAALRRYGWTREELLGGLTAADIRPPEEVPKLHATLGEQPEPRDRGIFVHRAKSGETFEVQVSSQDFDYRGRRSYLVVARDVSAELRARREAERDRQEAERARVEVEQLNAELQRAVSDLEAVLDVAPIGIGIARDPECREIRVNPAFAAQLGISLGDNASKSAMGSALPFRVMRDGRELQPDELPMQRATREGRTLSELELDVVHADGRVVRLLEYAAPLRDEAGRVRGAVGVFVDITERARLIAAERAAREEAERANRAKSEFLAVMSHELRTPLNAIQGHVQLLELGLHGPITGAQRDALDRVQRAQRHLLSLINDVLNYARIESGRVEYVVTPVLVTDVVHDVAQLVEPQVLARGLTFEVPPADGPAAGLRVLADREKLAQILLNLLSNAIKFTAPGGRVAVEVAEREGVAANDHVFLRVTDTGPGIPRDKLETVFEPFVQLRGSYAPGAGGTGLGLAISRDLARGMGGDLRARSVEGVGSAFTVALRRAMGNGEWGMG